MAIGANKRRRIDPPSPLRAHNLPDALPRRNYVDTSSDTPPPLRHSRPSASQTISPLARSIALEAKPIADGGFANVYRGCHIHRDGTQGTPIAVKKISIDKAKGKHGVLATADTERRAYQRFATSNLQSEVLATLHGAYREKENLCLVQTLYEGGDLIDWQQRSKRPTTSYERKKCTMQVMGAIHITHSHGMVHRDVKPANVLMTKDGNAVLADFGLVRLLSSGKQVEAGHKITGGGGTDWYWAPEVWEGEYDGQADYWALGVVLYQMCAGWNTLPFPISLEEGRERVGPSASYEVSTVEERQIYWMERLERYRPGEDLTHEALVLSRLLDPNPATRGNWKRLIHHQFFDDFVEGHGCFTKYVSSDVLEAEQVVWRDGWLQDPFESLESEFWEFMRSRSNDLWHAKVAACFGAFAWVNPNGLFMRPVKPLPKKRVAV